MVYKIGLLFALVLAEGLGKEYRLSLDVIQSDEVNKIYAMSGALLTHDEKVFLEDILAADDLIMERQRTSLVSQILSTISGASGILNVVGAGPSTTRLVGFVQGTAAPVAATAPAATTNSNTTAATAANQNANDPDNHLFNQISRVVTNSASRNVTGIVDAALTIGTPAPVRELVNGILAVAYCNGIRRLLGRC